jgi:hypothetical protein
LDLKDRKKEPMAREGDFISLKLAQDVWYELWAEAGSRVGRNGEEQEDTVTQSETNQTKQTADGAPRRPPDPAYWLIVKNENGWIEVLTLECDGREMLPVFSHEEEAEMFLRLSDMGGDWQASESRAGELVSVLYGPCADVKEVALDPLPEMVAERTVGLVSLDQERFIEGMMVRTRRAFTLCEPDRGSWPRDSERIWSSEVDRYPRGDDYIDLFVSLPDRQPRRCVAQWPAGRPA